MAETASGRDLFSEVSGHLSQSLPSSEAERAVSQLRNPFVLLHRRISRSLPVEVGTEVAKKKPAVRLALVSMPKLPLDQNTGEVYLARHWSADQGELSSLDMPACRRALVAMSAAYSGHYAAIYEEALQCAVVNHRADIICFNELAFPTLEQRPRQDAVAVTRQLAEPLGETDRGRFIVSGSYHDQRTFYNTGGLFFPGCPSPLGVQYHKQVSAVSVEERISLPPERVTRYATVFGLKVAVLICLDLADFASAAAVVRASDRIDLVLVPCYTEWTEDMERIARDLSRAMSGMVFMVNFQRPGHSGVVVTEFGQTLDPRRPRNQPKLGARIHTCTIRVDEFVNRKLQKQSDMPLKDRMEWLFGPRDRPVPR